MNYFECPEDQDFFAQLLCSGNTDRLKKFRDYFDFRSPNLKREEFNLMRKSLFNRLVSRDGVRCRLNIHPDCTKTEGDFAVDHVIPLSSNELNKSLRKIKRSGSKKVPTQSWGSNYIGNLVLACPCCNNFKKHKFLEAKTLQRILPG